MPLVLTPALQQVQAAWRQVYPEGEQATPDLAAADAGRQMARYILQTQFLLISDLRLLEAIFVSPGIERLLGCPVAEFSLGWLYSRIHPDDAPLVGQAMALSARWLNQVRHEGLDHVFTMDCRLRHREGHYVRVLRQSFGLHFGADGAPTVCGGIYTDITHHKLSTDIRFFASHPLLADWLTDLRLSAQARPLSERERGVLALLLQGYSSRRIAETLNLSVHTVNTHRRNITAKTQTHDLSDLLQHMEA